MKSIHLAILAAFAFGGSSCSSLGTKPRTDATKPQTEGELAFSTTVKPLIEKRCVWCHSNRNPLAGLNFQDRAKVLDPTLKFIVPGQPAQSRVYNAVTRENAHPRVMPGDGWGITTAQKNAIRNWIDAGAPWPEGKAGEIRRKRYQVDHDDYL